MRVDKFLKLARIIKRRTIANKACENEKVILNGRIAKPSKKVKVGDIISVSFGNASYTFKITKLPSSNVPKSQATALYEILEDANDH